MPLQEIYLVYKTIKCKMQKCKNAKKKADIIATAAYFFSKGLKGLKGFRDFKVPYLSDKAYTEGCAGSGHAAEGSQ